MGADGKIYIIELDTQERLELQNIPDSAGWGRTAKEGEVMVAGLNNPIYPYQIGVEQLKMRVSFYAEEEARTDVLRKFKWLKSLTYNNGYNKPRPRLHIVWGDMLKDEIWTLSSCEGDLQLFNKGVGMLPQLGYVDLTFKLAPKKNLLINDVR